MKPKLFSFLPFLLATYFSVAQTTIDISEYNVEQGLSQSSVRFIEQDSRGFLWIGTGEGLNRFDGIELKQYFKEVDNPSSINNNSIRGLVADKKGGVWVGTDIGLNYFNVTTNSFERFDLSKLLTHLVYAPAIVSDSLVFGSCADGKVFKFNRLNQTISLYPFPTPSSNNRPYGDKNGNIWYVINDHTLLQFDTKTTRFYTRTIPNKIASFNLDINKQPTLFCINSTYSLAINKDSLVLIPLNNFELDGTQINQAVSDNKCIWSIDFNNQLACYINKKSKKLTSTKIGNALSIVQTLFIDKAGNLWIATDGNGLLKATVQTPLFQSYNYTSASTINKNFIKCMTEGPDHSIYIGTLDQGIIKYSPDLSTYQPYPFFESTPTLPINCLMFDKLGNLWIATDSNITIHRENGKTIIIDEPFCRYMELWNEKILVRSFQKLFLYNSAESTSPKIKQFNKSLRHFTVLNDEEIFLSYYLTGANTFNFKTNKITNKCSTLADVKVNMLHKTKDNKYYLATDAGIIGMNEKFEIIATYNRKNGLPDHFVYSLLADNNGNLWGSTNQGVFMFNIKNKNIQSFGMADGLSTLEFNSQAYLIDKNGKFYFGGIKGFSTINPNLVRINLTTVPIYLQVIKNNDELLSLNKEIHLKSNQNDLYVEFALPDILTKRRNKLAILLKGLHKEWYYLNYKRSIKFESLPPGKYTLLAKSINSDGMESEVYKLATFKIDYPFWKNPYYMAGFSILVIAFFSFITLLIVRSRHTAKIAVLQKKNEIENIRKNIYRDLHDEIGAGLSRIKILSDIALIEKDHNEHSLELVKESATEITEKLREIVWSMNQENENLNKLAQKLQTIAEDQFTNIDVQLVLNLAPNIPEIELPPIKIRNILMVYRELLNNAIKHSQAKKITIGIQYKEPIFSIVIADNGIGFDTQGNFKNNNGLKIIQDRMNEIVADINTSSEKNTGTTTTILIPINNMAML